MPTSHDSKGVSSVLGITLLFAIVIGGTAVVVTVGAAGLDDTRQQLDTNRAEKALTQFDSRSAMVALGGTSSQGVELATERESGYYVDDDRGWMNVSVTNQSTGTTQTVANVTMGAVSYEGDRTTIAYQGGGVWKRTDGGVSMLSPPEFHFRQQTLTLPIIRVNSSRTLGSGARVTKDGPPSIRFPNTTGSNDFVNPLDQGRVNVSVHSDFYQAWGRYFEQRTDGTVYYDHPNETARTELVVPFDEEFDDLLATSDAAGIKSSGRSDPEPHETGVNFPSADSKIEDRIDECETGSCDTTTDFDDIDTAGTYYSDTGFSGALDVDASDGNVTVVVDGTFAPSSVSVTGDNATTVLVRNDFTIGSDLNGGGDPSALRVVVHSDGDMHVTGNRAFTGFIYAPDSHCHLSGKGYFEGGANCESIHISGKPNDFHYDESIEDIDLDLTGDVTKLTYLHVTVNSINVTSR